MRPQRLILASTLVAAALIGGAVTWALQTVEQGGGSTVPTALVRRGDLRIDVHATAELRAARALQLAAPSTGGVMQLVTLTPTGTRVRAGDVVADFDPSEQEYQLEQNQSELAQADEELAKLRADATVRKAEDEVAVLKARFEVRRAELDLKANELVGEIQAARNRLAHEEAQQRLAQLEADIKTRDADTAAARAVVEEKRNKTRLAVENARRNIERMTLRAPFDGLVIAGENRDASGGMMFFGMVLPEYREGDVVQPGRIVAEVFDTLGLELVARVHERERGNIAAGQSAEVRFDPAPGRVLRAKVASVGGMGPRRWWESSPRRDMEVTLRLEEDAGELQPGITAQAVIAGSPLRDVTYVPRQAVVERSGRPIVYVRESGSFEARPIKMRQQTEAFIVVEGVQAGAVVALSDPDEIVSAGSAPNSGGASAPPSRPGSGAARGGGSGGGRR